MIGRTVFALLKIERGVFMEDIIICRCEEITQREIEEAIEDGANTFNEVKRFTRCGMGLCQGRTCRVRIEKMIQEITKNLPRQATYRQPVRPVNLGIEGDLLNE